MTVLLAVAAAVAAVPLYLYKVNSLRRKAESIGADEKVRCHGCPARIACPGGAVASYKTIRTHSKLLPVARIHRNGR